MRYLHNQLISGKLNFKLNHKNNLILANLDFMICSDHIYNGIDMLTHGEGEQWHSQEIIFGGLILGSLVGTPFKKP